MLQYRSLATEKKHFKKRLFPHCNRDTELLTLIPQLTQHLLLHDRKLTLPFHVNVDGLVLYICVVLYDMQYYT